MPTPRCSYAIAINQLTGCIYVHGGSGPQFGSSNRRDLYKFTISTKTWDEVLCHGKGPCARYGHSAQIIKGLMLIFGGTDGFLFFNDLYLLDLSNLI